MSKKRRGKKSLFIMLFLVLMAISGFQTTIVLADVPTVLSMEPWISEIDTILNITVRHASPTSSHYVDKVEVDVDGVVNDIDLTPQSAMTFVVQFNMGEVAGTPAVQARAHCTFHGWSEWSESLEIPEFLPIHLLLILAVVPIALFLLRPKISGLTKSTRMLPNGYSA